MQSDDDLEKTTRELAYRFWHAENDSAEQRLILRELEGLLPSEMG